MIANGHISSNSYEKVKSSLVTNQNSIQEEIKYRLKAGNSCYSVQTLLLKNLKIKMYKKIILPIVLYGLLH
jgi:hypothetical protein